MAQEQALFNTSAPDAEAAADARAEAHWREGRVIGHDAVRRWLTSWADGVPTMRPRVGD
jgi:predicted transcriptional regulator